MKAKSLSNTAGLSSQSKPSVYSGDSSSPASQKPVPPQPANDFSQMPWMTRELVAETQRVWSPRYGYELSEEEAVEILTNTKRLAEVLIREHQKEQQV